MPTVRLRGGERFQFVNNMGTNVFRAGLEGSIQSVFTSATGRVIDVVTAFERGEEVVVVSSLRQGELFRHLDRYLFPMDDVEIEEGVIESVVDVIGGGGEEVEGWTKSSALWGWSYFCEGDAFEGGEVLGLGREVGKEEWERRRVFEGVGRLGREISEEITPLECGLWHLVSFEKGCYIGQETIARLNTYDGVKRRVCLMEFGGEVKEGMKVGEGVKEVLTSVCCVDGVWRALGRVKKDVGVGEEICAEAAKGVVMAGKYLQYGFENRSKVAAVAAG